MTKDEGFPLSGAASKFPSRVGTSSIAEQVVKGAAAERDESAPLVMVSELPEEALPNPEKFPLWIRMIIFGAGAAMSWGLIYALIHHG